MRLSELQVKEVINLTDGKQMGRIIDVIINPEGKINKLVVEKRRFFFSFFSSKNEVEVNYEQIKKIGEDVILVNIVNS